MGKTASVWIGVRRAACGYGVGTGSGAVPRVGMVQRWAGLGLQSQSPSWVPGVVLKPPRSRQRPEAGW